MWAAFFNFLAAFVFGTAVSESISKGLIDPQIVSGDVYVVLGGLAGAIAWNIITWAASLPSSSSHALFGGLGGAAVMKGGIKMLILPGKWAAIILFIFLGPMISYVIGMLLMVGGVVDISDVDAGAGWILGIGGCSCCRRGVLSLSHAGQRCAADDGGDCVSAGGGGEEVVECAGSAFALEHAEFSGAGA